MRGAQWPYLVVSLSKGWLVDDRNMQIIFSLELDNNVYQAFHL